MMTFDQSVKRLNEIVTSLQDPEVSLEQSIELYDEGTKLLKSCSETLKTAELKFKKTED